MSAGGGKVQPFFLRQRTLMNSSQPPQIAGCAFPSHTRSRERRRRARLKTGAPAPLTAGTIPSSFVSTRTERNQHSAFDHDEPSLSFQLCTSPV